MDYEMEDPQDSLNRTIIPRCPFTRSSLQQIQPSQPLQSQPFSHSVHLPPPSSLSGPTMVPPPGFPSGIPFPGMDAFLQPQPNNPTNHQTIHQMDQQSTHQPVAETPRMPSSHRTQLGQVHGRPGESSGMARASNQQENCPQIGPVVAVSPSPHNRSFSASSSASNHRPAAFSSGFDAESMQERAMIQTSLAQNVTFRPGPESTPSLGSFGLAPTGQPGTVDFAHPRIQNPPLQSHTNAMPNHALLQQQQQQQQQMNHLQHHFHHQHQLQHQHQQHQQHQHVHHQHPFLYPHLQQMPTLPPVLPFAGHQHQASAPLFASNASSVMHRAENQMPQLMNHSSNLSVTSSIVAASQQQQQQQLRPGHLIGHPRTQHPATSYASMLNRASPREQLGSALSYTQDTNAFAQQYARDNGPHQASRPLSPSEPVNVIRPSVRTYFTSGVFEESMQRSYEGGGLDEPGRPLQDFDDFVTARPGRQLGAASTATSGRHPRAVEGYVWTDTSHAYRIGGLHGQHVPRSENFGAGGAGGGPRAARRDLEDDVRWPRSLIGSMDGRDHELTHMVSERRDPHTRSKVQRRFATSFIDDLPPVDMGELGEEDRTCSICMELFGVAEPTEGKVEHPVRLPCRHVFGATCIRTWFRENCTCPTCRRRFDADLYLKQISQHRLHRAGRIGGGGDEAQFEVTTITTTRPTRRRRTSDTARLNLARARYGAREDSSGSPNTLALRLAPTDENTPTHLALSGPAFHPRHTRLPSQGTGSPSHSRRVNSRGAASAVNVRATDDMTANWPSTNGNAGDLTHGAPSPLRGLPLPQMPPALLAGTARMTSGLPAAQPTQNTGSSITPALPASPREREQAFDRWGERRSGARAADRRSDIVQSALRPSYYPHGHPHALQPTTSSPYRFSATLSSVSHSVVRDSRRRYARTDPTHDNPILNSPDDEVSETQ